MNIFGKTYFKQSQFSEKKQVEISHFPEQIVTSANHKLLITPSQIHQMPKLFPLFKEIPRIKKRLLSIPIVEVPNHLKKPPQTTKFCSLNGNIRRQKQFDLQMKEPIQKSAKSVISNQISRQELKMIPKIKEPQNRKSQFINLGGLLGPDSSLVRQNKYYSEEQKSQTKYSIETSNNISTLTIQDRYKLYQIQHELNKLKGVDSDSIVIHEPSEFYTTLKPYLNQGFDRFIPQRVPKLRTYYDEKRLHPPMQQRSTHESKYQTVSTQNTHHNQADLIMQMVADSNIESWEQSEESIHL